MEDEIYNPQTEAKEKGIKVVLVNFKTLNSFLTKSVIYLRESMDRVENRCALTYELVHHSRSDFDSEDSTLFHSCEEEMEIRKTTANKLVSRSRLYELLENYYSMDKIAEELLVTRDVLDDYLSFDRNQCLQTVR